MQTEELLAFLRNHKKEFEEQFGIVKIGLFGSFSRNMQNDRSDIDLLIELDDASDIYRKKKRFKQYLESQLHRKVDIAREKYLTPLAKRIILDEVIYV